MNSCSFQKQCSYVSGGVERRMMTAHRESAASLLIAECMWDHEVSREIVVSIYRNRHAQTHSQTLVASRCLFTPQMSDLTHILTHAGLPMTRQTQKKG